MNKIIECLILNEKEIREDIRDICKDFYSQKEQFTDIMDIFLSEYQSFVLAEIREVLEIEFGFTRSETLDEVSHRTITDFWDIDSELYNI